MPDDPQEHLRSMFMHKRLDVVSFHVVVSSRRNSRRQDAGNIIHKHNPLCLSNRPRAPNITPLESSTVSHVPMCCLIPVQLSPGYSLIIPSVVSTSAFSLAEEGSINIPANGKSK